MSIKKGRKEKYDLVSIKRIRKIIQVIAVVNKVNNTGLNMMITVKASFMLERKLPPVVHL